MLMSDFNGFYPLASPFLDLYAFEGYDAFSEAESHFDSSFASSSIQDDQHHLHVSSSFDSPQHQGTRGQSSNCQEFNGEHSWPWEELTENENRKPKSIVVSKTRVKWTEELHQKFVDCVNRLGGAQKATPKQLCHLMKTKGLNILHIKSHLQKYRISQHTQEFSEGKSEKKTKMKTMLQPNQNIGNQLMEVVRQQLDTQSSLHEHLEVQKNLISAMEEQMKQLRGILDHRRKTTVFRTDDKRK
ncbi:myb family transcription factor PHL5-like [Momordica charantia]|uniref:Myb family transcription factor PHL5-like n=1 Tax=Momordica charantia TaxID=3673 RepID=A0A6J1DGZ3_MOMCH|nr:myb family transcription factor PHL5-like [Momordica charantia]